MTKYINKDFSENCIFEKIKNSDKQKTSFEKFHVARQKQLSIVFTVAKPPKSMRRQNRANADDMRQLCGGGELLGREYVSLAEAGVFEYVFKFGVQIAIETLSMKD